MQKSISPHEVRMFLLLSGNTRRWFTSNDIASEAKVSPRTARAACQRWAKQGLLKVVHVWTGYRYRWQPDKATQQAAYTQALQQAAVVFGGGETTVNAGPS